MVRCKSTSRFSSIKNFIVLAQTDTTVGFMSQDSTLLSDIKSRPSTKPFIKIYNSLQTLKNRIPSSQKTFIRRSKKTTFIINNKAFRIDDTTKNSQILRNLSWHYSTSANESSQKFNREFCELKADIIIENKDGLRELSSSQLLKLNKQKIRKLR